MNAIFPISIQQDKLFFTLSLLFNWHEDCLKIDKIDIEHSWLTFDANIFFLPYWWYSRNQPVLTVSNVVVLRAQVYIEHCHTFIIDRLLFANRSIDQPILDSSVTTRTEYLNFFPYNNAVEDSVVECISIENMENDFLAIVRLTV